MAKTDRQGASDTPRELLQEIYDALCYGEELNVALWRDRIAKALAARPEQDRPARRNCDRFNTGDVAKDADDALRAMLDETRSDANFGFRGVAQYLLSPLGAAADRGAPVPGVRGATEEEVAAGDAQWCQVCRHETCPYAGHDMLVHGCNRVVTKDGLS